MRGPLTGARRLLVGIAAIALAGCGGGTTYSSSDMPRGMDDPASALSYFGDQNLDAGDGSIGHTYDFVHERQWDSAGWRTLLTALDNATTRGNVTLEPAGREAPVAALVAARVLAYLPQRDDAADLPALMRQKEAGNAAEILAHIITTYAVALDVAPDDSSIKPKLWSPTVDVLGGTIAHVPFISRDSFAGSIRTALSTDAGFAELRTGLNQFRAEAMTQYADQAAAGKVDNGLASATAAINDDIQIEHLVLQQIRTDPTRTTARRNARLSAWITSGTSAFARIDAIERGGEAVRPDGKTLTGVISRDIGSDTGAATEALDKPQTFPRGVPTLADTGALQEWYLLAKILDRGKLWKDPGALDVVRPGGKLISWDDLVGSSELDREAFVDQLTDRDIAKGFGPVEGLFNSLTGPYENVATPLKKK